MGSEAHDCHLREQVSRTTTEVLKRGGKCPLCGHLDKIDHKVSRSFALATIVVMGLSNHRV